MRNVRYYIDFAKMLLANRNSKKEFPQVEQDRTLRILGNGKSLSSAVISPDDNIDYMVVNRHVLADNYSELKPCYYVLADPHFFRHPEGLSVLEQIKDKTTWNLLLCVPYSKLAKESARKLQLPLNIRLVFYNRIVVDQSSLLSTYIYKRQWGMPMAKNVVVAAIMLGLTMEYSIIELYGVEHDWLRNLYVGDDNLVYLKNDHFYDKEQVKPKPQKEIQHRDEYPLYLNLSHYARMFQSYWEIRKYLESGAVKSRVINMTKGSYIDAFERG